MLLLLLGLTWCWTSVDGYIPPSQVCYQHVNIQNACVYGNISIGGIGRTFKPPDCNSHINVKDIETPPYVYINTTNATERFTVLMRDLGPQGNGPDYLLWLVTNVSLNTPNFQSISPMNIVVGYEPPLLMHGAPTSTLIQFLVFRHQNVLRVPFGEMWVSRRRNFALSTLLSNTAATLRLCGPMAGIQFWVHSDAASASIPPSQTNPQPHPVYVPVIVPVGQPGYTVPVQPGYPVPNTGQAPVNQQPSHINYPKKNSGVVYQSVKLLFVPIALFTTVIL